MEIINEEPDPSVVKQAVCKNCGVRVSYVPADVKEYNGHDYSGGPDGCKYLECPKCKKRIVLESW